MPKRKMDGKEGVVIRDGSELKYMVGGLADGRIGLEFSREVTKVQMTPEQAVHLGRGLMMAGYKKMGKIIRPGDFGIA